MERQMFLLGLRVILGFFCAVISGIDLAFNVYAVPLKDTFNFTQTQVEIVASMSCAGFGLSFIEILLTSTFGYITTFVVTWIGLPVPIMALFGLAALHSEFMHSRPVWVYLIQLVMSISNGITLTMVRNVIVGILPKKSLGTTIGLFDAAYCVGKIVYSGLLERICHNDLASFFFTTSIVSVILLSSFYPILYPAASNLASERDKLSRAEVHRDKESKEESQLIGYTEENVTFKDIFQDRFFHMTFWTTVVFSASVYTVVNNITSVTNSIGIKNSFNIVTTMSTSIMLSRIVYGLLFDKGASQAFAFWLLFSMYFSFALGLTLGLWFLNITTVYVIGVFCGIALGPANGIPVAMLVHRYGRSNLNPIFVALYFTVAVIQLVMQLITGYLYDRNAAIETTCQGTDCFYWSFLSLLFLTVLLTFTQCVNYAMTVHRCSQG